jgi:anti-sigma factor RsiW
VLLVPFVSMKMNEINNSPVCERAAELIAVLYGEATEPERRDFQLHMQQCSNCRAEFAAFGQVRESIRDWRDEALAGFVTAEVSVAPPARKSALAALRQFFDLSPLWMKGAVGLAAVAFCALAVLAVTRMQSSAGHTGTIGPEVAVNPFAVYTKQDVDRAVQEALANEREQRIAAQPDQPVVAESPTPNKPNIAKREPKSRRPFSKAEREQLAADLRLLSDDERDSYLWPEPNDK